MRDFNVGDRVRVTEVFDANWGMTGKIIRYDHDDDSYLVEFEYDSPFGKGINTEWYYGTESFVHVDSPSPVPPPIPSLGRWCTHDWKPVTLIYTTVYNCSKCGKKKEDA